MMPRHPASHATEPQPGLYWCEVCQGPADLEDPGEAFPRCVRCGKRKTTWAPASGPVSARVRVPAAVVVPAEAQAAEPARRLPAERRPSLLRMFQEGYYFCLGCETVTEPGEDGGCVLCGSSQVERRGPAVEGGTL